MRKITHGTGSLTTDSFDSVDEMDDNPSPPKSTRPRLKLRHLRLLILSACAVAATACASLKAADHEDSALTAAQAEAEQAKAQAMESMAAAEAAAAAQAAAEAAAAAAMKEAEMARSEADGAMKDAEMARTEADAAMKDAEMARSEADAASDKLMMATAPHPAEVMVSADHFDPDLLDMSGARASLAGPDSIYVSSIMYDGQPYSALLEYSGGTTATVASIFGARGKMIPDSVDLSRTRLIFRAPDKLVVADVAVGSAAYSGELTHVGGNRLQVTGLRGVVLPPTADEQIAALRAELAAAEALVLEADVAASAARAEADAAMADAGAAMADAGAARAEADAAMADAGAARAERDAAMLARSEAEIMAEDAGVAQWVAETDAAAARAELEAMIADAFQPSAVMISDDQLDPGRASLAGARVVVAGPDSVYVSSIMYDGQRYSALLKYTGGTTAEVRQIYGSAGKLIPDSVDLSQTELTFVAPNAFEVSNVSVGGVGYSGTLAYTGGGKLQVTGIRRVELPQDALADAQAALAQVEAALAASQADNASLQAELADAKAMADDAQASADMAMANADMAMADADMAMADADLAKADLDAMMADAFQPSAVMISDGQIDPSRASFADARVAIAGPDAVYVSSILYDGQRYSALLRYTGGTTAEVKGVYGTAGKLIPDSVDLSQTALVFTAPNAWEVSNVSVGGVGYSGTLAYAGDGKLQVTGIRQVELPPTALEEAQAALAEVEAALAASQAANDALQAENAAQGEMIASLEADLAGAQASADMAMADADMAMADADMAKADLDAMMADAFQPSAVMISDGQIDPSRASFADARVAIAGPDAVYVSSILYDGQRYSALLRYTGGTTAEVKGVYGTAGKLIPDSVDLSQTALVFTAPNAWEVSNVSVGGVGYSGTLAYAGDGKLQVTGIRQVELPPTALEEAQAALAEVEAALAAAQADNASLQAELADAKAMADDAQASADMAMADADMAMADADMAKADLDAMMADAFQPSAVMISDGQIDPSRASFADARVAIAGPDAVYVSSILYDGQRYSALLRYTGGTTAEVKGVYGTAGKLIPDSVDLSQTALVFTAPNAWEVSNVSVGGVGYSGTLAYAGDGKLQVTGIRQVELPPTALEEAQAALAEVEAALAAAQAANNALQADNDALQAELADAKAMADDAQASANMAMADADMAMADADMAKADADMAKADLDAMMADAFQPSAVMISDGQIDPSRASFADARVAIAGPDAVYVSSILYDGQRYSALLRYTGGTTAEVRGVYGTAGKLIPDSVDLSQTALVFTAPNAWEVSNVSVGGVGYSGTLAYAGDGKLQVTGIRQVELPPTALEEAQAALAEVEAALAAAQAENSAQGAEIAALAADLQSANDMAAAAQAAADEAQAEADMAGDELAAMIAAAFQPSAIMISDAEIDPSRASFAGARVAVAGPDSVYVSSITYDGQHYSALLRYAGGTTAEVSHVFGSSGKMIPDSVDLSQTELVFVSPNAWEVSNVSVGGVGYSGTLAYAGDGKLQVTGIRQVELPPTTMELLADAKKELEAAVADATAKGEQIASLEAELQAAQAALAAAQADADAAQADADAAQAAADAAQADADTANAELDAMKMGMEVHHPAEVMVSFADLDASLASFDDAVASLAGPDAVYVSNIMYAGRPYSALLKYEGGTTATVKQVFGPDGKLIPDSVSLAQTAIAFRSPDTFAVSNVAVGGTGYSGTLQYTGDGQLQVTGIRRVTLPPTEAEKAEAAIANAEAEAARMASDAEQMVNDARAEAEQMVSDARAEAAQMVSDAEAAAAAAVAAAMAEAEAAQAELEAMKMAMRQASEVMVSFGNLDAALANFDSAQASLAGPDMIYISSIMYDGQPYSALVRYEGGTTATVLGVFGAAGKLIPDAVGLSQTTVAFVSPDSFAVSNVEVGGVGYSGTLQYTGDGQLQVTGIRRVTLPPTEAEKAAAAIDAAMADADAKVSAAMDDADAMVSAAKAEADRMVNDAKAAADAKVSAAMADADADVNAAMARAAAAEADLDAMKMAMHQPSAVQVAFSQLDAGLADFGNAQVSLAGPDAIYVSNIRYDSQPYSALLKYDGGTSATVQYVFGPVGKLIPDSVDLSQTTVAFESPDSFRVSNVGVGGAGYAGTLQYTGDGQLQVTGLSRVNLPTKPEMLLADARADLADARAELSAALTELAAQKQALDAANADLDVANADLDVANADLEAARLALAAANNALAAANGELDAANGALDDARDRTMALEMEVAALMEGSSLPGLNVGLLDLESATLSAAGANEVYISGIQYAGAPVSARIRYDAGTATATALFEGANLVADSLQLDAAQPMLEDDKLVISNVGINGRAHTLTLTRGDDGQVMVVPSDDGWEVRTRGELARDNLIRGGNFVVNGFAGGQALVNEGSWTAQAGSVIQTDTAATHAKYSIPADQSASELLFGFSANAEGGQKVGFGLHILASATPQSGNTWNYGKSYLLWVTQDPFYDSEDLHLQFYESADDNTLMWLASSRIPHGLSSMINVEALYRDTGMTTLLVNGEEQLTVNIGTGVSGGDRIALRTLGGPVEFTQVYVAAP